MKKGIPKFTLLSDPNNTLEGRVIIFRSQYPKFLYELNRDDVQPSVSLQIGNATYTGSVLKALDNEESKVSYLEEAIRWYHYSQIGK